MRKSWWVWLPAACVWAEMGRVGGRRGVIDTQRSDVDATVCKSHQNCKIVLRHRNNFIALLRAVNKYTTSYCSLPHRQEEKINKGKKKTKPWSKYCFEELIGPIFLHGCFLRSAADKRRCQVENSRAAKHDKSPTHFWWLLARLHLPTECKWRGEFPLDLKLC